MEPRLIIIIAVGCAAIVALGEWLHARRVARVTKLAFGPTGRAARWTSAVPVARTIGAALAAWGLLFLASWDPIEVDRAPAKIASNHLLVLLDVSPSMQLADAGPTEKPISRAARAGEVIQGVLDRLDMEQTRITIVAFYTKALPIVQDTFDKEVVRNALDGLPMYAAFEPGPTDLGSGIRLAHEIARVWPAGSATMLIVTDGDVTATPSASSPASIADTIVIGLGDANRGMSIHGHSSRQDAMGLRQLALRLGGIYHDGNRKHLPSEIVRGLTMVAPRVAGNWSARDVALACVTAGSCLLGFAGPLLTFAGRPRWTRSAGQFSNNAPVIEATPMMRTTP